MEPKIIRAISKMELEKWRYYTREVNRCLNYKLWYKNKNINIIVAKVETNA